MRSNNIMHEVTALVDSPFQFGDTDPDPAADLGPHEQLLLKHFRTAVTVRQCQIEDSIAPDAPLWKIYLAMIAISLATWTVIIAGFVEVYPIVKGFLNAISS